MTEELQPISNNSHKWEPVAGKETLDLLTSKGFSDDENELTEEGNRILFETRKVLKSCGNPELSTNGETGLVIGYVQSGKTLSFTTLTALARDNDYQMVIVIAGTSTSLVGQSTNRLKDDLRLSSRFDRKWTLLANPHTVEHVETIRTNLAQWSDETYPNNKCRTILITVMKHGGHLANLTSVLTGLNLEGVPTLIIDDEGDQASMNTRARRASREEIPFDIISETEVSTIYRRLNELRNVLPHHTFLQYTATPQANLFINIMDRLSPNFIRLLTPGDAYTGGKVFFRDNPNLIQEIPITEIPSNDNPLFEPPESLITSLKFFFVGVSAGLLLEDQRNRSMLVHPSRLQMDHATYYNWVRNIVESWKRLLSVDDEDDKTQLLNEFKEIYDELALTAENIPSESEVLGTYLVHAINYTQVVEVNSRQGATPQIPWQDFYSWILVGGQSMDRGFTVEGLTVTYMPRNLGVGNVDTVQQRARFFGYKRSYLGFCRVFLDQVTIDAYNGIVEHEEDVRNRLEEYDVDHKHLNDWDREVVLDRMLRLTRTNILYDALDRDRLEGWFRVKAPHDTESLISNNIEVVESFFDEHQGKFESNDGHQDRTEEQTHLVADFSIETCLNELLNKLKYTRDSDSASYSSLRGLLSGYIEANPNAQCKVYLMSAKPTGQWTRRVRRLNANDEIQQLFQGKQPTRNTDRYRIGEVYPGDSQIKDNDTLSIQIHRLNLRDNEVNDCVSLAIWIPDELSSDIVRQKSNGR